MHEGWYLYRGHQPFPSGSHPVSSGDAGVKVGQSAPHSETFAKNLGKRWKKVGKRQKSGKEGKQWEKEEKMGRKGKTQKGSFTLPLLTYRAGYSIACKYNRSACTCLGLYASIICKLNIPRNSSFIW